MHSLLLLLLARSTPSIISIYCNAAYIISNPQKYFYQDSLSFVCLQLYKQNCLNILASNIHFRIQVKNHYK